MSKMTTLYDVMWKDLDSNFVHTNEEDESCLKTISIRMSEKTLSYRFTDKDDGDCLRNALTACRDDLKRVKKELENARKARKNDYEKYKCKKDEFDAIKTQYDDRKKDYDKKVKKLLIKRFGLEKNEKEFSTKYDMAVSGSGNETFKITRLHSSSLCCLLLFYNVSANNSLTLQLETNRGKRTVEFTESIFEFKNKVFNAPSNIDVVLIGTEKNNKDKSIVLFLESKFAEYYYDAGGACDIGGKYITAPLSKWLYEDKNLKKIGLKKTAQHDNKGKIYYKLENESDDELYIYGIKQMISHYCGIKNLLDGNYYKSETQKNIYKKIENGATVIFGAIVFYLPNGIANDAITSYYTKYNELAKIIASQENNDRFEILNELLPYSIITEDKENKYKVDEKVKAFYRMN